MSGPVAMLERGRGRWLLVSLALHAVGVGVVGPLRTSTHLTPRPAMAIEIVREPPPAEASRPPEPPRTRPAPPRPFAPAAQPAESSVPATVPSLLDAATLPSPREPTLTPGSALVAGVPSVSTPGAGETAGVRQLLADGDLLAVPGPGVGTGTSAPQHQNGVAARTASSQVAAAGAGLTALARPIGGYQVKPAYPETARRDRAEGVALLRFEVLVSGRVGDVHLARSAGHPDLDRAAIEAVKQWQFEPARRGATAVPVWVTLPVRFELSGR